MMEGIPSDALQKLKVFNDAMKEFEDTLDEYLAIPCSEQRPPLEKARLNLTSLFTLNSLYWMYVSCKGKQPKDEDDLSVELRRAKSYMEKLKTFDEYHLRPQVNKRGTKAFVRNALFDINAESSSMKEKRQHDNNDDWDGETNQNSSKKMKLSKKVKPDVDV